MLTFTFFIIFEYRLISSFIKRNSQQPASVGDTQRYVTIMTLRQSFAYVRIVGMEIKCKYITIFTFAWHSHYINNRIVVINMYETKLLRLFNLVYTNKCKLEFKKKDV